MRFRNLAMGAFTAMSMTAGVASMAHAGTVMVQATDDIWLAGQPSGAVIIGYFGTDTAPADAPVALTLSGATQTFLATGSTSVDGSNFGGPDGASAYPDQSSFSPSPWSNDYDGPASSLVGVYESAAPTLSSSGGYTGPSFVAGPDYTQPGSTGPGAYSPLLDQIFIIGDGLGETFTAPVGATTLYLGTADSLGANANNVGSLSVSFTGATAAVPEPAAWVLMVAGLGMTGGALRFRRRSGAALA